jgi:hypothetical protein|tara:strand:+ start:95 stop:376 length:282 start_codon:yes stop_codon:yes gene_type:complete
MDLVDRVVESYKAHEEAYYGINVALFSGMEYNKFLKTPESIQSERHIVDVLRELDLISYTIGAVASTLKFMAIYPHNLVYMLQGVVTREFKKC